jgi:hypothetical protein
MSFIKEYGTIIVAIFGAGGWLGFVIKLVLDNRKDKKATIKSLQNELDAERVKNRELSSIAKKEKLIDKSRGSVYIETVGEEKTREICGFCWEKEHVTVPVIIESDWDDYRKETYYGGKCQACKSFCSYTQEDELPF